MAKVISIINNKGGVGKTTSTAFFGEILSLFGKRVLLVDTDESGNLSLLFNQFSTDSKNVLAGIEDADRKNIQTFINTTIELKKMLNSAFIIFVRT